MIHVKRVWVGACECECDCKSVQCAPSHETRACCVQCSTSISHRHIGIALPFYSPSEYLSMCRLVHSTQDIPKCLGFGCGEAHTHTYTRALTGRGGSRETHQFDSRHENGLSSTSLSSFAMQHKSVDVYQRCLNGARLKNRAPEKRYFAKQKLSHVRQRKLHFQQGRK